MSAGRTRTAFGAAAIVTVLAFAPRVAHAEDPQAQQLFDEGKALMDEGRAAEACTAFAESNRLEPGIGTTLHLAKCREATGDLVAAWTTFDAARSMASARGDAQRVEVAEKYMRALDGRLGKVRVVVPEASRVEGLAVELDGKPLSATEWEKVIRIPVGEHVVRARAAGQPLFTQQVTLGADARAVVVRFDGTGTDAPAAAASADAPTASGWSGMHTGAVILGSVGVTSAVVGIVFGVRAFNQWGDAETHCFQDAHGMACSAEGIAQVDDATLSSSVSTAAFVGSGVAVGAGLLLWALAPSSADASSDAKAVAVVPLVGEDQIGLSVGGSF